MLSQDGAIPLSEELGGFRHSATFNGAVDVLGDGPLASVPMTWSAISFDRHEQFVRLWWGHVRLYPHASHVHTKGAPDRVNPIDSDVDQNHDSLGMAILECMSDREIVLRMILKRKMINKCVGVSGQFRRLPPRTRSSPPSTQTHMITRLALLKQTGRWVPSSTERVGIRSYAGGDVSKGR